MIWVKAPWAPSRAGVNTRSPPIWAPSARIAQASGLLNTPPRSTLPSIRASRRSSRPSTFAPAGICPGLVEAANMSRLTANAAPIWAPAKLTFPFATKPPISITAPPTRAARPLKA